MLILTERNPQIALSEHALSTERHGKQLHSQEESPIMLKYAVENEALEKT